MSSNWIPDSIVIKPASRSSGGYAFYSNENVRCNENSIFSELARIDVETAKINRRYIHLRFRHTNKYWSRRGTGSTDNWIVATSTTPEEDTSNPACTMFEPTVVSDGRFMLEHVQSGGRLIVDDTQTNGDLSHRVQVFTGGLGGMDFNRFFFDFVNLQTVFKMPRRVAMRGNNERWLRAATVVVAGQSLPHAQFSSADPNERESAYEIELNDDGHIRIKSAHFDRYLRRDNQNNWLLADAAESNRADDTLFWPVLVRGSNYALRSKGNRNFIGNVTADSRTNCLRATASTMSLAATFLLRELVLERHVYHTRFLMDQAHIEDERTIIAGTGTSVNNSDSPSTLSITISYEETRSYTFTNSTSTTTGVATTISGRIPIGVSISNSSTKSFEWGETVEETRAAEASLEVTVPPRSGVRVDYVGTQATTTIPFNYTQRDKSSSDGMYTTSSNIDGILKGVDYHSFHFEQHAVEKLVISNSAA